MSSYPGQFSIKNATGVSLANITIIHACNGEKVAATLPVLNAGEVSPGKTSFNSYDNSKDYWYISWYNPSQKLIFYADCYCSYEREDSGNSMQIVIHDKTYDIVMPVSSSCTNKSTDSLG